jgi:anti-sigma regulatory factor (Ser/Thr protein kinase)
MSDEVQQADVREQFYRRERRSIPAAREFAGEALKAWGLAGRADDVLLCVSELTTNALLHGVPPGRGFLLQLSRGEGGVLRVEVHDSGDPWPAGLAGADRPQAAPDEESGRGLALVAALADKWDVMDRRPGKIVWCEFVPREVPD